MIKNLIMHQLLSKLPQFCRQTNKNIVASCRKTLFFKTTTNRAETRTLWNRKTYFHPWRHSRSYCPAPVKNHLWPDNKNFSTCQPHLFQVHQLSNLEISTTCSVTTLHHCFVSNIAHLRSVRSTLLLTHMHSRNLQICPKIFHPASELPHLLTSIITSNVLNFVVGHMKE